MRLIINKTEELNGRVRIPSSKSHTIRAIIFASLASGKSEIRNPLFSEDTKAAINACKALGAKIEIKNDAIYVEGFSGKPGVVESKLNTLNSGTTTNLVMSIAALVDKEILVDGDESIRKRPVQPLIDALNSLGARVNSLNNDGCPPLVVKGRAGGGKNDVKEITIDCKSSQYLSSLLISCPLLDSDTIINVRNICEKPYIDMTLRWLDELGIKYENHRYEKIKVFGRQQYDAFNKTIPADWSSATFLLVLGTLIGKNVEIEGLNIEDTQADKQVLDYLHKMGARISIGRDSLSIRKSELEGCELDLNNTPDALPAIAVLACFAKGITLIRNVAHARIKETDRIKVMALELTKMGAKIKERDDGLEISNSILKGSRLNGHHDHRVVMALSIAGMLASGKTEIDTAEAINVTFPDYIKIMKSLGAKMEATN